MFKYLLAIFMIVVGVYTALLPLEPAAGQLGFIFAHRISLIAFGAAFAGSGLTLLIGKIKRSRRLTGKGLLAIYLCFVFGGILNGMSFDWALASWLPNILASLVVGALWLRWKMKTEYIDPKHFVDDYDELRPMAPPSNKRA